MNDYSEEVTDIKLSKFNILDDKVKYCDDISLLK